MSANGPDWQVLRVSLATEKNRRECGAITRKLLAAGVPAWRSDRKTTKGSDCIWVHVPLRYLKTARRLVSDLL